MLVTADATHRADATSIPAESETASQEMSATPCSLEIEIEITENSV